MTSRVFGVGLFRVLNTYKIFFFFCHNYIPLSCPHLFTDRDSKLLTALMLGLIPGNDHSSF